jgi:hypothetical protein
MKRLSCTTSTLLFILAILFANPYTVHASEGDGEHQLKTEVNGYHVTLSSRNEWANGENNIIVTLTDGMGNPVRYADVTILIAAESDEHAESESDTHDSESEDDSMPGMDMGEPGKETPSIPAHEEENVTPIAMIESDEHGMYVVETHLESLGEHEVQVIFHANGEMLQADFVVEVSGIASKTIVLWSFVVINAGLVSYAGILKKQSITVKVRQ